MIRRAGSVQQWPWVIVVFVLLAGSQTSCEQSRAERRGRELFQLNCAPCHEAPNPDLKKQPPKLEGLFQSKRLSSGAPSNDEHVCKTFTQGIATMQAFDQHLSDEDVYGLVKYLQQLK